ncbi:MAG: alpha-glucosidase [Acetatifactor sp.]
MDKKWWKESVVYQIYPRSFCDSNGDGIGDLRGIISKLDYLERLGVDVLWLCPIFKSPNDDNGYDISDYRDIMDEFGTLEDFDELLEKAHEHHLKIMLDLVVNHSSDEHKWFLESSSSKDNPYRDYYIWQEGKNGNPPNNWDSNFSGSAWKYDEKTDMYYLHLFSEKQPDLNWRNPVVRNEVYDLMRFWLDKGIDGFRMDVINMISKVEGYPDGEPIPGSKYGNRLPFVMNGPHVHEYLQEMNREVLSKYDVMTVGEAPCTSVEDARKYTGFDRNELNMVFTFEHMDVDAEKGFKWTDRRVDLVELKRVFSKWQEGLDGIGWNSLYLNNHDQPRMVSRFGNDGEYWKESAKMLAVCLHMQQGTPYIYQGEEIGMKNMEFHSIEEMNDIEAINAFQEYTTDGRISPDDMLRFINHKGRDNARTPMQWNAGENAGFTTGSPWLSVNPSYREINVEAQEKDEDSILNFYRRLIRLRKDYPIITYGSYKLLYPDSETIFAYERILGEEKLLVVCSFAEDEIDLEISDEYADRAAKLLISNYPETEISKVLHLLPYEARVYRMEG